MAESPKILQVTPHQRHASSRQHRSVGGKQKELGMLMLLLAAETVADCCSKDTSSVASTSLTSTELFARSTIGMLHNSPSSTRMQNNKVLTPEPYETISSAGDSDTATPVPESATDDDLDVPERGLDFGCSLTIVPSTMAAHRRTLSSDSTVIKSVLQHLSWRENLNLRRVNRTWFEASLPQATVCRMPVTGCPAVFLPCRRDLDALEIADETRLSTMSAPEMAMNAIPAPWMCPACGWFNDRRPLCGNRSCHALAPQTEGTESAMTAASSQRIFLGQLRREATVSLIRWMFEEVLLEPEALLLVENHRHKLTNRGKGCAWVYVRSQGTAVESLLSYHRRLFIDNVNGVEGAWIVHPAHTDSMQREVAQRGYAADRPRTMPRNALVTELPLAQVMRMSHHDAAQEVESVSAPAAAARRTMPSALSPYAVPFTASATSGAPLPSYEETVGHDNTKNPSVVDPAHMISPTVRRHNPYAAATVSA
jgi:hypothetical protein